MPLLWVAYGLVLVLVDLALGGWDLLPDPVGWVLVLVGLVRAREHLGTLPIGLSAVALVVSVVVYPPGLVRVDQAAIAWGLSLPQVAAEVAIAFALTAAVPARERSARLCGWLLLGVGAAPAVVLGGDLAGPGSGGAGLVGLLAFVAVLVSFYLVYLLTACARQLPDPATAT